MSIVMLLPAERSACHRSAILMGVVKQAVNKSAGKSGVVGND